MSYPSDMVNMYTIKLMSANQFLISSYGAPLAQRTSNLGLHSSLFGPDGEVNYDYIITNSIDCLLIGSRCLLDGAHTDYR